MAGRRTILCLIQGCDYDGPVQWDQVGMFTVCSRCGRPSDGWTHGPAGYDGDTRAETGTRPRVTAPRLAPVEPQPDQPVVPFDPVDIFLLNRHLHRHGFGRQAH